MSISPVPDSSRDFSSARDMLPGKLLSGREMIRVGMRVDEVMDAQAVARSHRGITIDETDFRIDEDGRTAVAAADQIGLATASAEPLEDHSRPPSRRSEPQPGIPADKYICSAVTRLKEFDITSAILGR